MFFYIKWSGLCLISDGSEIIDRKTTHKGRYDDIQHSVLPYVHFILYSCWQQALPVLHAYLLLPTFGRKYCFLRTISAAFAANVLCMWSCILPFFRTYFIVFFCPEKQCKHFRNTGRKCCRDRSSGNTHKKQQYLPIVITVHQYHRIFLWWGISTNNHICMYHLLYLITILYVFAKGHTFICVQRYKILLPTIAKLWVL